MKLGWHPLMRITATGKFRKDGSKSSRRLTALVPKPGRSWQGRGAAFPRHARAAARLHALGLLGARAEGGLVRPDRSGARVRRGPVVRHAGLDRARVQAAQERRLAMAAVADDRPRASGTAVAGAGGGHAVRAGLGRGGGGWEGDRRDVPRTAAEGRPVAHDLTALSPDGSWCPRPAAGGAAEPSPRHTGPGGKGLGEPAAEARLSATPQRIVSVFRQGLAVLVGLMVAGQRLPAPAWSPEPWLELRHHSGVPQAQSPLHVPINPSQ